MPKPMTDLTPNQQETPRVAKLSHATAISLGLMKGRMYRGAVNRCVNLLVHYPEGCSANCAYCGLARNREGSYASKSFIHVQWPLFSLEEITAAIRGAPDYVKRSCVSMITNGKSRKGTLEMVHRLSRETSLPISVLVAPSVLKDGDLEQLRATGADKVGVALDLVTPELFDHYRGSGVSGPHRWETYWEVLKKAVQVFGDRRVGAHLMVGMGETESQVVSIMDTMWGMGIANHLFSFFAEKGSRLAERAQPPWSTYLRVQLARYLIETDISHAGRMSFDARGRITDFGVDTRHLMPIVDSGTPFMTTGCLGPDGKVACNRPFGNCLPDVMQWNYPYPPNHEECALIREHLFQYP